MCSHATAISATGFPKHVRLRAIYIYVHECVAVCVVLPLVVGSGAIGSHYVLLYLMVHSWAATSPC